MMINSTHTDMDNSTENATVSVAVAARQLLTYKVCTGVIFIVKDIIKWLIDVLLLGYSFNTVVLFNDMTVLHEGYKMSLLHFAYNLYTTSHDSIIG